MSTILSPKTFLSWPDYLFVLLVLALCVAMSFYFRRKKALGQDEGGNLAEFLLASRTLSVFPATFSVAATSISAFALTTLTGEVFLYGGQQAILYFSDCIATVFAAFTIVPIFRQKDYVSVFQLLEERFDGCVRRLFSLIFIINKLLNLGLMLYLPALSLTTLAPFDVRLTTSVLGFLCTAYSSLGGFRTVVWTDVIQCVLLMTTLLMVSIQGSIKMDLNLGNIWQKSTSNGFLNTINWTEGEGIRYSIWAPITYGILWTVDNFALNQAIMQRVLSAKTNSDARKSVILSGIVKLIIGILVLTCGSVLYLLYGQCSPLNAPEYTGVTRTDQLIVYAIGALFEDYPVLRGLAISGIVSASLSTFSSFINAFAAITLEDFVKPLFPHLVQNENQSVKLCMIMSFAFGTLGTMIAIVVPLLGNVIKVLFSIFGIFSGPICGISLLLVFYKNLTKKGCIMGTVGAMLFNSWLIIGNALYVTKQRFTTLNITNDECETDYWNVTSGNLTDRMDSNLQWTDDSNSNNTIFMGFYKISSMWYLPIGFVAAIVLGVLFSHIIPTAGRNFNHLSIRKMYSKIKTNNRQPKQNSTLDDLEML